VREIRVESEIGEVRGWASDEGVAVLGFAEHESHLEELRVRRFGSEVVEGRDGGTEEALRRYFEGDVEALDALRVDAGGTDFQRRVWAALREVEAKTSYGAIAAQVGSSARAVGNANARNPVALVVPCHRVIGMDDSLTGYAYGVARKAWLLAHERRARLRDHRSRTQLRGRRT